MSKRQNTSSSAAALNVKRSRKAAGFRLARPATPDASQPTTSSNSSLFVTVAQNEGRAGFLARSRVITSDLETVEPTLSTYSLIQDPSNEMPLDDLIPDGPEAASVTQEATEEPKRKRQTTNYVRPFKQCTEVNMTLHITRINSKNGYHSGTFSWMRFSVTMVLEIFWVRQNVRSVKYMMES